MEEQCDTCDACDFLGGPYSMKTSSNFSGYDSEPFTESDAVRNNHKAPLKVDLTIYVALGAIRVHRFELDGSASAQFWLECTNGSTQPWPNPATAPLVETGALKVEYIHHVDYRHHGSLRIFALAEDSRPRQIRTPIAQFRRSIKFLLPFIDTSLATWDAKYDLSTPIEPYNQAAKDHESLFYIFNTLDSPPVEASNDGGLDGGEAMTTVEGIPGLKTKLYPYQSRSVATMVHREQDPVKCIDPRKPPCQDLLGRSFYFDYQDGIILRQPHRYEECRGGVLAETMGYGKTLICLGLILATRGHYPAIPEGRLEIGRQPRAKTGSLLEMAAAGVVHQGVSWKAEFHAFRKDGYHFDKCAKALRGYAREYMEPIFHPSNPSRKGKREHEKVVRLCSATLVVVPSNLLVQWQQEIKEHTEVDALDVLVIDQFTKIVPDFTELIKYDIVLITKSRLEQEYRDDDLNNGKRGKGEENFQSPLTKVRWLRIVCDEGHGFAGSASRTNALAMIDKLYIERKWVVSGTPSSSMLGVEVGLAAEIESSGTIISDERFSQTENVQRRDNIRTTLQSRRSSESSENEAKDLEKLRLLVVNFLKVKPWANSKGFDHANWNKYFAPFDSGGNRRKVASLRTLLQSLIVRHRIEDIDADLCLPPLHNRSVLLQPSYYDKLSMNLFVLVLISNAITSERTDEDYMFHPKNRKQLEILISNLRQSAFHWVGFRDIDVSGAMRNSETYLDRNIDNISDIDGALLTEAIMNSQRTLQDAGWRAFSVLQEIGVYLEGYPSGTLESWSIHGQPTQPLLLGTVQARSAQKYVCSALGNENPTNDLENEGREVMELARTKAAKEAQNRTKASTHISEEHRLKDANSLSSSQFAHRPLLASAKRKRDDGVEAEDGENPSKRLPQSQARKALDETRIVGFTSAKLTYLMDQVLKYQDTEKIIIFYDANNIGYWIAEALELLGIKFLIYANTLTTNRRATYLATFNQKPEFRVLLMDLKQAAHGLHVACASRVYIVNPIWQPNIESQAIKRAHRIGQKRPVYVETLVLRGTIEDKMLNRRKAMTNHELQKARTLLDDFTMAEVIKNETFIKFKASEGVPLEDPDTGKFSWNTPEDAKVARLAVPRPFFGLLMNVRSPEDGLVMAAGDAPKPGRNAPNLKSSLVSVEEPASKKLKMGFRQTSAVGGAD